MIKIGMVGVWHVHTDDYFAQLSQLADVEIALVWDEDAQAGAQWGQAHGVAVAESFEALLASDIDAIVCDAPTTRHPALLEQAAKAGKHIFTEKLLATSTGDALAICDAIDAAGVLCVVSLPLLPSPMVAYARQQLASGALGRVTGARMRRSHNGVSGGWLPERWFDVGRSGGGALMDLGAHPAYVLCHLLGAPKRVSGMMNAPHATGSDENAIALIEFEGGALATCETAFVTAGVPDLLELYGEAGSIFLRKNDAWLSTKDSGGPQPVPAEDMPAAGPAPIAQFIAALQGKGDVAPYLLARAAVDMTRVIEAAYQSDETGTTVTL